MTGLLIKKYHIAILDENQCFLARIVNSLKGWYNNKIVIKTYKNSESLIEAVNLNKAKNNPFDLTVLRRKEYAEKLILQRSNPNMTILVCDSCEDLKKITDKLLL